MYNDLSISKVPYTIICSGCSASPLAAPPPATEMSECPSIRQTKSLPLAAAEYFARVRGYR